MISSQEISKEKYAEEKYFWKFDQIQAVSNVFSRLHSPIHGIPYLFSIKDDHIVLISTKGFLFGFNIKDQKLTNELNPNLHGLSNKLCQEIKFCNCSFHFTTVYTDGTIIYWNYKKFKMIFRTRIDDASNVLIENTSSCKKFFLKASKGVYMIKTHSLSVDSNSLFCKLVISLSQIRNLFFVPSPITAENLLIIGLSYGIKVYKMNFNEIIFIDLKKRSNLISHYSILHTGDKNFLILAHSKGNIFFFHLGGYNDLCLTYSANILIKEEVIFISFINSRIVACLTDRKKFFYLNISISGNFEYKTPKCELFNVICQKYFDSDTLCVSPAVKIYSGKCIFLTPRKILTLHPMDISEKINFLIDNYDYELAFNVLQFSRKSNQYLSRYVAEKAIDRDLFYLVDEKNPDSYIFFYKLFKFLDKMVFFSESSFDLFNIIFNRINVESNLYFFCVTGMVLYLKDEPAFINKLNLRALSILIKFIVENNLDYKSKKIFSSLKHNESIFSYVVSTIMEHELFHCLSVLFSRMTFEEIIQVCDFLLHVPDSGSKDLVMIASLVLDKVMDNKELICRFMAEVVQPGINYYPPSADDEEPNIMQILFTLVPKKFGDFLTQNIALMSKSKIFFSLLYMMNEVMLSKLMQKAVGLQAFVGMSYVYGKFLISEFNENFDQLLFDNKTIKTIFETLTKKQTGDVEAVIEESYIINLCVELILKYPLGADEISLETIDNKSLIAGIWLALKNYHSYLEILLDSNLKLSLQLSETNTFDIMIKCSNWLKSNPKLMNKIENNINIFLNLNFGRCCDLLLNTFHYNEHQIYNTINTYAETKILEYFEFLEKNFINKESETLLELFGYYVDLLISGENFTAKYFYKFLGYSTPYQFILQKKLSDTHDFGLKSYNLSVHVKLKEYVNAINLLFPNSVSEDEMNLILNAISICSNLIENDIWTEFFLELINSRSIRLDSINILLKNYENNLEFLRNEPKILYSILKQEESRNIQLSEAKALIQNTFSCLDKSIISLTVEYNDKIDRNFENLEELIKRSNKSTKN